MLTKFRKRMGEVSGNFNKEIENTNKNQVELKNTITEIKKNIPKGINSRLEGAEEQISSLEHKVVKIT